MTIASITFAVLESLLKLSTSSYISEKQHVELGLCHGRFKLWSRSMGARLQNGDKSLTYRLRDNSLLKEHVLTLLGDMNVALGQALSITSADYLASSEEASAVWIEVDQYFEEGKSIHSQWTELDRLCESIRHSTDCLMRLSVVLRSPEPLDHLTALPSPGLTKEDAIRLIRDRFPNIETTLADRMGHAACERFQYFRHRDSLAKHGGEGPKAGSTGEEGIDQPQAAAPLAIIADRSVAAFSSQHMAGVGSQTAYTPGYLQVRGKRRLKVPYFPDELFNKPYICDYCHLHIEVASQAEWKRHLFRDLRPYLCFIQDCPTPLKLYAERKEWERHLQEEHVRTWLCPSCSEPFQTLQSFRLHTLDAHSIALPTRIGSWLEPEDRKPPLAPRPPSEQCEFCECKLYSNNFWFAHVADHMEQWALFTLPDTAPDRTGSKTVLDTQNIEETSLHLTPDTGGFNSVSSAQSSLYRPRLYSALSNEGSNRIPSTRDLYQTRTSPPSYTSWLDNTWGPPDLSLTGPAEPSGFQLSNYETPQGLGGLMPLPSPFTNDFATADSWGPQFDDEALDNARLEVDSSVALEYAGFSAFPDSPTDVSGHTTNQNLPSHHALDFDQSESIPASPIQPSHICKVCHFVCATAAALSQHHAQFHARRHPYRLRSHDWEMSCDYTRCPRHSDPFRRKDHYRNHLREFHKEDVEKPGPKDDEAWWHDRIIKGEWWRCKSCLNRVVVRENNFKCPTCGETMSQKRQDMREPMRNLPLDGEEGSKPDEYRG